MERKRRRNPAATKARILDSAEALFAENGFADTRTRDIARRARVSLATLHHHWVSKQRLYAAVYERLLEQRARHAEQLFALLGQLLLRRAPREELLQAVVEHLLSFFRQHPHAARLYTYQFLEAKRVRSRTLEPQQLAQLLQTVAQQVRSLVAPEVAHTVDVELTLLTFNLIVLVSFLNPAVFPVLLGAPDPAAAEERLTRYLQDTLGRLFLRPAAPNAAPS